MFKVAVWVGGRCQREPQATEAACFLHFSWLRLRMVIELKQDEVLCKRRVLSLHPLGGGRQNLHKWKVPHRSFNLLPESKESLFISGGLISVPHFWLFKNVVKSEFQRSSGELKCVNTQGDVFSQAVTFDFKKIRSGPIFLVVNINPLRLWLCGFPGWLILSVCCCTSLSPGSLLLLLCRNTPVIYSGGNVGSLRFVLFL